jgi:hypothetical protein
MSVVLYVSQYCHVLHRMLVLKSKQMIENKEPALTEYQQEV